MLYSAVKDLSGCGLCRVMEGKDVQTGVLLSRYYQHVLQHLMPVTRTREQRQDIVVA